MQYSVLKTATKELCTIADSNTTYDTAIGRWLNFSQQDFANEVNWKYLETRGSSASSTYQFKYTLPSDYDVIKSVIWEHSHYLRPVNHDQWIRLNLSDSEGTPRYYIVMGGSLALYPKPDHTGGEETLLEGMSGGSTDSMVLTSTGNIEDKGRILIGSEVIEFASTDSLRLKSLIRGAEGTTSTFHLAGATLFYRNIEYDYYKILSDMSSDTDMSQIPERYHRAMPIYAAAQFFYKTEDQAQGDKYMAQYMMIREQARKDLAEKQTQKWTSVLDDTPDEFPIKSNTYPEDGSLEYK